MIELSFPVHPSVISITQTGGTMKLGAILSLALLAGCTSGPQRGTIATMATTSPGQPEERFFTYDLVRREPERRSGLSGPPVLRLALTEASPDPSTHSAN